MSRNAIGIYSVRKLDEDLDQIIDRIAAAGFDGVQFADSRNTKHNPVDNDPDELSRQLEEHGLEPTPAHVSLEKLEDDRAAILDAYSRIGVDTLVIPWLDQEHFESEAAVDRIVERVNELADDLATENWGLSYHNHAHEYIDLGDQTAFDRFIDGTEIGIELDVGWAMLGGDDPVDRIEMLGDRLENVHLKDLSHDRESLRHSEEDNITLAAVDAGLFREIGDGDVPTRACANAATTTGVEWLIYEHDEPVDPISSIDHGGFFLDEL